MGIKVSNVTKTFGGFTALKNVTLDVPSGELVALLGPSGSGKTTLLRIIAGLDRPDQGTIHFDGVETTEQRVRERQVGFVFQHYALFRHMTVFKNISFGLEVKPKKFRPSKEEIKEKVHKLLKLIQLDQLASRYPSQLSGGQRQRVALARALAVEPKVLLLDEPFGALDARVREELRRWLRRLHDEIHVTSVFVTHDQEEALEVADRVVVMNEGQIEQAGTPEEVYEKPSTPFVYNFLGNVNLFHSRVHEGQAKIGNISIDLPEYGEAVNIPAVAYVRPYDIEVNRIRNHIDEMEAIVLRIQLTGATTRLELILPGTNELVEAELTRDRSRELALSEGENVFIKPRNIRVFLRDQ